MRDSSVVKSSVMPSAKYPWSGSLLRLAKGSTTIDRRGARSASVDTEGAITVAGGVIGDDQSHHRPPAMISKPARTTAATCRPRKDVRVSEIVVRTSGLESAAMASAERI